MCKQSAVFNRRECPVRLVRGQCVRGEKKIETQSHERAIPGETGCPQNYREAAREYCNQV